MRRILLSTLVLVVCAFLIPACSSGESEGAAGQENMEEEQMDDHEEEDMALKVQEMDCER